MAEQEYTAEQLDRAIERLMLAEDEHDTVKRNADHAKAMLKEAKEELNLAQRAVTKIRRGLDAQTA